MQKVKLAVMKTEEERHAMERKAGDTELMVHRMVEEAEREMLGAKREEQATMKAACCSILRKIKRMRLRI